MLAISTQLMLSLCYICVNKEFNVNKEEFTSKQSLYPKACENYFFPNNNPVSPKENEIAFKLRECMKDEKKSLNKNLHIEDLESIPEMINSIYPFQNNPIDHNSTYIDYPAKQELNLCPKNELNASKSSKATHKTSQLFKFKYHYLTTIFLILVYSITIILSILGNILVLIVMCCGFRSSFLDISTYLMHLSIFNLLMSIFCIPFTSINALLGKWIFSSFMCPFTNFIQLLSVNGSIFTLTTLAINRYIAVAYPIKYNTSKTRTHNRKSLLLIWAISIALASVQLFIYKCVEIKTNRTKVSISNCSSRLNEFETVKDSYFVCREIWDSNESTSSKLYLAYTVWIFMQTFCLPVVILIIMYSRIIAILWKRNCNSNNSYLQENVQSHQSEQYEYFRSKTHKTIRMLCVVILTFAVNWLPIHIFYLYLSIANFHTVKLGNSKSWMAVIFFICHWMSMSNSFINPIIYSFMNKKFKTDLYHLLHCNKLEKRQSNSNLLKDIRLLDQANTRPNENDSLYQVQIRNLKGYRNLKFTSSLHRNGNKKELAYWEKKRKSASSSKSVKIKKEILDDQSSVGFFNSKKKSSNIRRLDSINKSLHHF